MRAFAKILPLVFFVFLLGFGAAFAQDYSTRAFDIRSWIETPRVLYPALNTRPGLGWSPDQSRFLLITVRGDLSRNGNWVEFYSSTEDQIRTSPRPLQPVARLFTAHHELPPLRSQGYVWLNDNTRVAFAWNDGAASQILVLDLSNGRIREAARHTAEILSFDITPDGTAVAFVAQRPIPDARTQFDAMLRSGFAISSATTTVSSLLAGYPTDESRGYYAREMFIEAHRRRTRADIDIDAFTSIEPFISPDGRWVALWAPPSSEAAAWRGYSDSAVQEAAVCARARRESAYELAIGQLWLVDSRTGRARTAWDAPFSRVSHIRWRADSLGLTFWPTFFPISRADEADRSGLAIATFDLRSRQFSRVPLPENVDRSRVDDVTFETNNALVIQSGARRWLFNRRGQQWRLAREESTPRTPSDAFARLEQGITDPPRLIASNSTGTNAVLVDISPELRTRFTLGKVEIVQWQDVEGRRWSGRLYYPSAYQPGRPFPLVISTMPKLAVHDWQFSTSGNEVAATVTGIGQALAGRGVGMLIMAHSDDPAEMQIATPHEKRVVLGGYESAISSLAERGLVAADRVGLVGFSRSGSYVEYAITHSDYPFAAALAADNVTHGYLSYVTLHDFNRLESERQNGGASTGEGLRNWLSEAAGFNAHRVRTPFRSELDSGGLVGVLDRWELFSQLRYLGRPVELYVIPDIERGSHGLELPNQQLASLGGAVDWFDFWLNDHEGPDPAKREQYARWHGLREQRDALSSISTPRVK